MRLLGILLILILITSIGSAQNVVTNETEYEQEELQSRSETEHDLSDREELLDHLSRNPILINFADPDQLAEIPWLNDLQIKNLILYRKLNGYILSPFELQLIEGFDRETIESIVPYISFSKDRNKRKIKAATLLKDGRNDILIRPSGFNNPKDSLYLGSPLKLLLKYKYNWQSRVSAGCIIEKDAGEPVFKRPFKKISGFDYTSAFLMVSNTGIFSRLIIGDYHLRFGQGLAIWSGYNIGRTIFASGYSRKAPGIVQNSSSMETGFMRGTAATLTFKKLSLTGFFSASPLDARLDTLNRITSLVTDGLHRDSLEWSRRHNAMLIAYGGRIAWKHDVSEIGINLINGIYSNAFAVPSAPYRIYDFKGTRFRNMSLDHRVVLGKLLLSGEIAISRSSDWAIIQNLMLQPTYGYTFFISFRDYSPAYRAPFGNCLGESGLPQNERGVFLAATILINSKIKLRSFADFYQYPWLKYRIDAPSAGSEQQLQLEWKASPAALLILKIGNKNRPLNMPVDSNVLNKVENQHQLNIRLTSRVVVSKQMTLQSRFERNQLVKTAGESDGYLFLQDVAWNDKSDKVGFTARVAFYSASYDNRFYTYENDHRFSFSTPMLYGKGTRMYLFSRIRFWKNQTVTFKIGTTSKVVSSADTTASSATAVSNITIPNSKNPLEMSMQFLFRF